MTGDILGVSKREFLKFN